MNKNPLKAALLCLALAVSLLLSACGAGAPAPAVTPNGNKTQTAVTPDPNAPGISKPAFTPRPGRQEVLVPQINRPLIPESSGGYTGGSYSRGEYVLVHPPVPTPYPFVYLPYQPLDSSLAIISVSNYDGIFVEDGSDTPVSGITAALVINLGAAPIEYASVELDRGDTILHFELTDLPPGEYLAVQEKNRTAYVPSDVYYNASVISAELSNFEFSEYEVAVYENDEGGLTVENITDKYIPSVRVFYKFYSAEAGGFVGGITYTAVIENLLPGELRAVKPSHYAPGYSQVVMVRTYY